MKESLDILKKVGAQRKHTYKRKTWFQRMESSQIQWRKARAGIANVMFSKQYLDVICINCKERDATIKCTGCYDGRLCFVCDEIIHNIYPLHDRKAFIDGYLQPLSPLETLNEMGQIEPTGIRSGLLCNFLLSVVLYNINRFKSQTTLGMKVEIIHRKHELL